jgi:hypothetical protein
VGRKCSKDGRCKKCEGVVAWKSFKQRSLEHWEQDWKYCYVMWFWVLVGGGISYYSCRAFVFCCHSVSDDVCATSSVAPSGSAAEAMAVRVMHQTQKRTPVRPFSVAWFIIDTFWGLLVLRHVPWDPPPSVQNRCRRGECRWTPVLLIPCPAHPTQISFRWKFFCHAML